MIQLGGQMGGRRGAPSSYHFDSNGNGHHSAQRPPSAGDFPTLEAASSKPRTAGQPASKKNWKEAALAVELAAASKEPVPAQEREREREKEREKEKLVNLVPKAPTPKKGSAHGKGAPPGKNPRDRDNRAKLVHEPPPPPKPVARSESPVSASGGMVVLSLPKASKTDASAAPMRRPESAPPPEPASPVLLPAVSATGSSPSQPNLEAASATPPATDAVTNAPTGQRDVRQISPSHRTTSSLMQHFTSPPLDEAEELDVPLPLAEEELRFMKELGWQEDAADVAPLTTEEIMQFQQFATMARPTKSLHEQRVLADRSLTEWAKRRVGQ